MQYGSPAQFIAFVLALVSGTLLALGDYLAGAALGLVGLAVFGLWRFAEDRGGDARHPFW